MLSPIPAAETIIRDIGAINEFQKILNLGIDKIDLERNTHIYHDINVQLDTCC